MSAVWHVVAGIATVIGLIWFAIMAVLIAALLASSLARLLDRRQATRQLRRVARSHHPAFRSCSLEQLDEQLAGIPFELLRAHDKEN